MVQFAQNFINFTVQSIPTFYRWFNLKKHIISTKCLSANSGENCSRTKLSQLNSLFWEIFREMKMVNKQIIRCHRISPLITFGNIDVDAGGLRVGRPAGVVAAVADLRLLNN